MGCHNVHRAEFPVSIIFTVCRLTLAQCACVRACVCRCVCSLCFVACPRCTHRTVFAHSSSREGISVCAHATILLPFGLMILLAQLRCIAAFGPGPSGHATAKMTGFAIGGIDGRCAVGYVGPDESHGFAFKCHRDSFHAYAVNSVHFHPQVRQPRPCAFCHRLLRVSTGAVSLQ